MSTLIIDTFRNLALDLAKHASLKRYAIMNIEIVNQEKSRTGMLQDICEIPEDFDSMMADEIESLFSGDQS